MASVVSRGQTDTFFEGSATQQNRVRDYVIFAILPRLHWDYTRFAQGLHIFIIQELAVIY